MTTNDVIGNIRRTLEEKGLRQRDVAERLGMRERYFCDILHGRRTLKLSVLLGIADAMGVDAMLLLAPEQCSVTVVTKDGVSGFMR